MTFGHSEPEAVPAGVVECVPQRVGVFDNAPHAARATFGDVVHAVIVGEGDLRSGTVLRCDGDGGGLAVLETAIAQRDAGAEIEAGQKPHDQCFPRSARVHCGGAVLGLQ